MNKKESSYKLLEKQLTALLDGEDDLICAMANASAAIFYTIPDLNWAGFYRVKDSQLILGPFQGQLACTRIQKGKGVCGTAWKTGQAQLVPDVHQFPGHIACDSSSNAEIVIPLRDSKNEIIGVLDIDSPVLYRFDETDLAGFQKLADLFSKF